MIRIKPAHVLALIAMTSGATVLLRAEDRMRTGLWEVSTSIDGKPAGPIRSTCYTPAMVEVANTPEKMLRQATEKSVTKGGLCTLNDFKLDKNRISMTVSCGAESSAYVSTYTGASFETVITTADAGVRKVIDMKGRRTGDCPVGRGGTK
jgi:Protein of unknown function (DUF3617)